MVCVGKCQFGFSASSSKMLAFGELVGSNLSGNFGAI